MKKITLLILVLSLVWVGKIFAQEEGDIVVQGDKGKFILLNSVLGARAYHISPNGMYVTGVFGPGLGYVYNTVRDTMEIYDDIGTPLFTNNDKFIAGDVHITKSSEFAMAGFYNEATKSWDTLVRFSTNNSDLEGFYNNTSCWGLAGNSKKIAGMMYKPIPGTQIVTNYGVIWENGILTDTLLPINENPALAGQSYGSRPNAISEDGSTIVGWASSPTSGNQRSPYIWRNGVTYYVGDAKGVSDGGECFGVNADGTIVCGGSFASGAIWRWNGSAYIMEEIPPSIGYTGVNFTSISENEVAVGYMWIGLVVDRIPVIYTKNTGIMDLNTYLWELYGINALDYNLFTPMSISKDGRKIVGFGFKDGVYTSYYISLEDKPINTRPLRLAAKQVKNSLNVSLSWAKPYNNGKTVKGYNVYRDGIKVNTSLVTELKYVHENIETGQFVYNVSTVFEDLEESKKSEEAKLQVIEIGGCYSVKRFENEIIYNRTIEFNWGLPSSEIIENASRPMASTSESTQSDFGQNVISRSRITAADLPQSEMDRNENSPFHKFLYATDERMENENLVNISASLNPDARTTESTSASEGFDYISMLDLLGNTKIALFKWGDIYYIGDYNSNAIACFDLRGNFVNSFTIEGLPSANGFTTDGENVYVACGTKYVYKVDLIEKTILDQIRVDSATQRICYIPELDEGKGGFEIGGWNSSIFINKQGQTIGTGFDFSFVYATVYHKGKIYASQQTGKNYTEIREYNFSDKQPTGLIFDVVNVPQVKKFCEWGGAVGGLNLVVMEDSTLALAVVVQATYLNNIAVFLELESMPGLLGFNVYKNGSKLNTTPLQSRSYKDVVFAPGKYEYYVTSLFDGGCESAASRKDTLEIFPIGVCSKVDSLAVQEIKGEAFLKWALPVKGEETGELLGFNIYRDQEKLNKEFIIYTQYRDKTPAGQNPLYRIEAFYNNSCVASDSIQLAITGNGSCDKIHLLQLEKKADAADPTKYNVDVKWDLPYYEAMYPLTWGNDAAYTSVGIQENAPFTVAIGFEKDQIADFLNDYKVVGMDFFLGDDAVVDPIVLIDEVVKYNQAGDRMKPKSYNRIMFETPISLKSLAKELVVGYTVSNYTGFPAGVDYSETVSGFGDLFSLTPLDMTSWTSANPGGNWAISILLAKDRDIATASIVETVFQGIGILDGLKSSSSQVKLKNKVFETPCMNKNTHKLIGFNVYRDDVKLNTEPIQSTQYSDKTALDLGNYTYKVGSLWNECDEMLSDAKMLRISTSIDEDKNNQAIRIYPNPARNEINIEGRFERAEIVDISGKILNTYNRNTSKFSVDHLKSGVYILRLMIEDRVQHLRFVIQ